jgi:hypothetical protein
LQHSVCRIFVKQNKGLILLGQPKKKADRFCDLLFSSLFSPTVLDRDTLLRPKGGTGERISHEILSTRDANGGSKFN